MRNLFDELVIDSEYIADEILTSTNFSDKYFLTDISIDKPMTFKLSSPIYGEPNTVDRPGFYCIFKNNIPIYVGATGNSIAVRISRFVKEVWNKSVPTESHSAAKKYRQHFGIGNFDGIEIVYHFFPSPKNINMRDIERHLIRKIKPLYNVKT